MLIGIANITSRRRTGAGRDATRSVVASGDDPFAEPSDPVLPDEAILPVVGVSGMRDELDDRCFLSSVDGSYVDDVRR